MIEKGKRKQPLCFIKNKNIKIKEKKGEIESAIMENNQGIIITNKRKKKKSSL